jgi:hypothetical protein
MGREAQRAIGEVKAAVNLWRRRQRHDFRFREQSSPNSEGVVLECARCGWEHALPSSELAELRKGMTPPEIEEVVKGEARKLGVWDDPCPPPTS